MKAPDSFVYAQFHKHVIQGDSNPALDFFTGWRACEQHEDIEALKSPKVITPIKPAKCICGKQYYNKDSFFSHFTGEHNEINLEEDALKVIDIMEDFQNSDFEGLTVGSAEAILSRLYEDSKEMIGLMCNFVKVLADNPNMSTDHTAVLRDRLGWEVVRCTCNPECKRHLKLPSDASATAHEIDLWNLCLQLLQENEEAERKAFIAGAEYADRIPADADSEGVDAAFESYRNSLKPKEEKK